MVIVVELLCCYFDVGGVMFDFKSKSYENGFH